MKKILFVVWLWATFGTLNAGTMGDTAGDFDFSGFYGGLGTGFTTFFVSDNHSNSVSSPYIFSPGKTTTVNTAIIFEGQLGYGWYIKQKTYLGAKASIYYTPIEQVNFSSKLLASDTDRAYYINNVNQISIKPIYNIDAVIGYEVYPHLLPFVEAGVSFANVVSNDTQNNVLSSGEFTNYNLVLNPSGYKTGYNVGIGANYQINQHWFVSSELVYNYLGRHSATNTVNIIDTPLITQQDSTRRVFQLVSLFASVSYLFAG